MHIIKTFNEDAEMYINHMNICFKDAIIKKKLQRILFKCYSLKSLILISFTVFAHDKIKSRRRMRRRKKSFKSRN